ncbi:hypothetical protein [Deinococcus multiflagellatus]|uniref:Uncharacterized protein n=1 Tax=Deinococcus multiflagellatus TaxID=1656887 RepID=A0ABW1ZHH2_9DEIO|nr:hypothetical protein [Deinococcus multiflagellatus]MBZ9714338.1 hypothetical protein [Deinococcus multiflagellatus]
MLVIVTAYAGASAMGLLVLPDHRALRVVLALVPFAFIIWAGAELWRTRGRTALQGPPWPLMAALAWPALARPILKLARQETLTGLDIGFALLVGVGLIWVIVASRRAGR